MGLAKAPHQQHDRADQQHVRKLPQCLAPTFQREARTAAASPLPSEAHPKRLSWRRSPRIQKGVWET